MKKLSADSPHTKLIAAASAFTWMIAIATSAGAAQLQEARVTQVVNDVKLLLEQRAPRPAVVSDLIRKGAAVRTGTKSRSELTFADLTITRLGANTIFSFKEGTREMNLIDGAILFQVPKGSGGATIRTVGVTAAITGTTGIAEFHPATTSNPLFSKWLCLEGTFHLYLPNGQSVELGPGKMVTADGKSFSKVLTFDIAKLVSTSLFFTGFDQPLASMSLIMLEAQNQLTSGLLATNPLDPTRIVDVTSQAFAVEQTNQTPPPPPPSKFGTPSVISSPVPYLITNGTVITTDPSITTNGVTDYGKIYRGQTDDGAFSLWAFGSTSAFDTALRIDDVFFADPTHLPIAVFKFQSLSLTGDPTIDTSNGGVMKLALIGVDGIISGPPGGTLTFTGLDLLMLATVNGSINLTSDVSFQDLHELVMYARGAGSDLTINSPISNIGILGLVAEDSIHLTNPGTMSVGKLDAIAGSDLMLQIGGSLLLNGRVRLDAIVLPGASVASGANLTLNVAGDYTNNSATESSRLAITNRDHIGTGGNIGVNIGGDLTAMNDFNLVVQNTNGQIDNGGNITLEVGGGINVNSLLAQIDNSNGGSIGTGGNLSVTTDGDFATTGDAIFIVHNTSGTINNGGNLNLTLNGNAQVNSLSTYVQNYDQSGNRAGHIGTGGNIEVEVGGNLTANSYVDVFLNNRAGGMIDSGGNLTFNVGGALTTLGYANFAISNRYYDFEGITASPTIGSDVTLDLHADSASIGGNLGVFVSDRGGTINGNALLNFNVTRDVTVTGSDIPNGAVAADIELLNDSGPVGGATSPLGGTIHGDATLQVNTANLTLSAGSLDLLIINANRAVTGGTIDGNATLDLSASAISVAQDFDVEIQNQRGIAATGSNGGSIGGDATLSVAATSLSVGAEFDAFISNFNNSSASSGTGGNIAGSATLSLDIPGNISVTNDFNAGIDNQRASGTALGPSGGFIGSDAALSVAAGSISVGGALNVDINNRNNGSGSGAGGSIGGNAAINLNIANTLSSGGAANFRISNESVVAGSPGGSIGGDATINVNAANVTANSLLAQINNSNGGMIGGGANVAINIDNNVTTPNGIDVHISNSNSGHIVTGADVLYSVGGTTSTTDLVEYIDNSNSGTIDNGGNVTLHTVGPVMLDGVLDLEADNFNGGTINNGGNVTAHFVGDVTATLGSGHSFNFFVVNGGNDFVGDLGGGTIGTGGNIDATFDGDAATTPTATTGGFAAEIANDHGSIGTGGNISLTIGGNVICSGLFVYTSNRYGGQIGTGGNITLDVAGDVSSAAQAFLGVVNNGGSIDSGTNVAVNVGGDVTTQSSAEFDILNNNNSGSGGGTIGGNATLDVNVGNLTSAPNVNSDALVVQIDNRGGSIGSDAIINFAASGNVDAQGNAIFQMLNFDDGVSGPGAIGGNATISLNAGGDVRTQGNAIFKILNSDFNQLLTTGLGAIGGNATISLNAANISTGGEFDSEIDNSNGGSITGSANLTLTLAGGITTQSDATFVIRNPNRNNNFIGGAIGGDAVVNITAGGDINALGNAFFEIGNAGSGARGGTIGGDARVNVSAGNISIGGDLFARIFNRGGSIGGNAAINMNVSGSATVTNSATVAIFGNDPAGSAAINFNGGSYDVGVGVGGTFFLSQIDGNGTITFNNASAHADVLKAGVFGANGVLNVGGGGLSADTTLKLYAPGSNGQLNFVSNVTLGGNGAKILAANSVTIFDNIVVTIGGSKPADVYTGFTGETPNANYSGFGGNGTTTGTFAGAGANDPLPLGQRPPFGPSSPHPVRTGGNIHHATIISPRPPSHVTPGENISDLRRARNAIHVSSSDELLSLLDDAAPGPGGKITIPASKRANNSRNSSRIDPAGRLNSVNRLNVNRRAMDMRTASSSLMRRSPQ